MVNYNRLAGKLKEDLAVFSQKISKGMKCLAKKIYTPDALWNTGKQ